MSPAKMSMLFSAPITVLVGHAGTGKTNTALGISLALAAEGFEVTLADLDVVNPYFRASDYPELLAGAGIRLIAPVLARTTLDTPSLTGELDVVIEQAAKDPGKRLVIDVGGDDDGATTIGRWASRLTDAKASVLYVVSAYRSLTLTPEDAAGMLPEIEAHAHLRATGVLNTSNLAGETTLDHVRHGRAFAQSVSTLLGLPLVATVVPQAALGAETLEGNMPDAEPLITLRRIVRPPWDE